jgi:DNA-binding LacI/PurR family transcriptional regulator
MPTMHDVARLARVSIATVSATLSGKAYVSPELQARVQAAIEELGYAPNGVARGLKQGSSNLLGLIIPDITNPFYTEFVHDTQALANAAGYSMLLCVTDNDPAKERDSLRLMRTHRVAGTVLCPTHTTAHESLRPDHAPLVLVDNAPAGLPLDAVALENDAAAYMATAHIVGFGHERIGTVAGPPQMLAGAERLAGYERALRDHALVVDGALIRFGQFLAEEAYAVCRELYSLPAPPTALFVANNHMLIGVMQALSDLELSCPMDVSIVSIDDFSWARAFTPKLTTVRQPVREMAQAALGLLLGRMANRDLEPSRKVLGAELIVRDSCRPWP